MHGVHAVRRMYGGIQVPMDTHFGKVTRHRHYGAEHPRRSPDAFSMASATHLVMRERVCV